MTERGRIIWALICNFAIVIFTLRVIVSYFKTEEGIYERGHGVWRFKFFTTDSNVFSAIAAFIILPFEIISFFKGDFSVPSGVLFLKYLGTSTVALTFLTVAFFLGPTQGYGEMYGGTSFFTHLTGPVLAIISFCFLEDDIKFSMWYSLISTIPMILYTSIYYNRVMNRGPLDGGWEDFYGFNVKDRWKISLVIMLLVTFITGWIVLWLHNSLSIH